MAAFVCISSFAQSQAQNHSVDVQPDSGSSHPEIYEVFDDRVFSADSPFRISASEVGVLIVDEAQRCNGIMLNPMYVLTARHCVVESVIVGGKETLVYHEHMQIELVLDDFAFGKAGVVVRLNPKPSEVGDDLDYALLEIYPPVSTQGRHLGDVAMVRAKDDLYVIGAPGAGEVVKLNKTQCHAEDNISTNAALFNYSCLVVDGSSGSGVFNFHHQLVGMHVIGGKAKDGTSLGTGISISALISSSPKLRNTLSAPASSGSIPVQNGPKDYKIEDYRLSDGIVFEKRSTGWIIKTPGGKSRPLKLQDAANDVFLLWDRSNDDLYLIPRGGGKVTKREGTDPVWTPIGTATKDQ
jgi:V8-like Glu-specific endopeptidase